MTPEEEKDFRFKQLELGLSDDDCNAVIENLKIFMQFSDQQTEFSEYIMNFIEKKQSGQG